MATQTVSLMERDDFQLAQDKVLSDLCVLVASLFIAPPNPTALEVLCDPDLPDMLEGLGCGSPIEPLRQRCHDTSSEATALDRSEYFAMLAVPGGRYLAPFEASACDEREIDGKVVRGLLMGPSTRAVAKVYQRHGFQLLAMELPDHVGCEVSFIGEIWKREAAAMQVADANLAEGLAAERCRFVRQHAARWIPALCDRIAAESRSYLYRALALLLKDLLARAAQGPAA